MNGITIDLALPMVDKPMAALIKCIQMRICGPGMCISNIGSRSFRHWRDRY